MNVLNKGDMVIHNTFPPVEGHVSVLIDMMNDERKIGVKQSNGLIYYDKESAWNKIEVEIIDIGDGVIDVDFSEV